MKPKRKLKCGNARRPRRHERQKPEGHYHARRHNTRALPRILGRNQIPSMNTDTQLAVRPSRSPALMQKLARAKEVHAQMIQAETALYRDFQAAMRYGWQLGFLLSEIKEEVGHGNWLLWLNGSFRELGRTEHMVIKQAERCMTFYKRNPNSKNSSNFDPESVRKFMWGYIPKKERPQLKGDYKDTPAPHYLTFVNNFDKWDRQVQIGQALLPSMEVLRRELERPLRRIIDLCGREWARKFFDD
jgi:hypothetical protein